MGSLSSARRREEAPDGPAPPRRAPAHDLPKDDPPGPMTGPGAKSKPGQLRRQRRIRQHGCWDHLIVAPLWVAYGANLGTLLRTCDAVGACMAVPNTEHYHAALERGDTLVRRPRGGLAVARRDCRHPDGRAGGESQRRGLRLARPVPARRTRMRQGRHDGEGESFAVVTGKSAVQIRWSSAASLWQPAAARPRARARPSRSISAWILYRPVRVRPDHSAGLVPEAHRARRPEDMVGRGSEGSGASGRRAGRGTRRDVGSRAPALVTVHACGSGLADWLARIAARRPRPLPAGHVVEMATNRRNPAPYSRHQTRRTRPQNGRDPKGHNVGDTRLELVTSAV